MNSVEKFVNEPSTIREFFVSSCSLVDEWEFGARLRCTGIYAAPEALRGETAAPPVDMYAVGICLYVLLSGQIPGKDLLQEKSTSKGSIDSDSTIAPVSPFSESESVDFTQDDPDSLVPKLEKGLASGFKFSGYVRG